MTQEDFWTNDKNGWGWKKMISHLMKSNQYKEGNWRIEIYESQGGSYEQNDKGYWDMIEWGDGGGSNFYLYDKMNGLREED